jgi:hypothetical protein
MATMAAALARLRAWLGSQRVVRARSDNGNQAVADPRKAKALRGISRARELASDRNPATA